MNKKHGALILAIKILSLFFQNGSNAGINAAVLMEHLATPSSFGRC